MNAVIRPSLCLLKDLASWDRGEAGNQPRQDPEREEQRHHPVADQVNPHLGKLGCIDRAHYMRRDSEEPDGRQPDRKLVRPLEPTFNEHQVFEEALFALDTDERHAQEYAEEDHGRHNIIGKRMEWVRRNIERDEVQGRTGFDQSRAEKGRALDLRKDEWHQHNRA